MRLARLLVVLATMRATNQYYYTLLVLLSQKVAAFADKESSIWQS
jgi:hypothetical protein